MPVARSIQYMPLTPQSIPKQYMCNVHNCVSQRSSRRRALLRCAILSRRVFDIPFHFYILIPIHIPLFQPLTPSLFTILLQIPVLSPCLFNLTRLLSPRRLRLQRNPTLVPLLPSLHSIRQQRARNLLILRA